MNNKEFNMQLRIFRVADMASREEDQERTVANQSRKRDKSQRSMWTTCSWTSRRNDKTKAFISGKRTSDKSCAQHRGLEENEGRKDMPKADGMAARDRIGVRGHHREIADKLDRVIEHTESDGSRMINEDGPVGSSKSNGIAEGAIQSVQGRVRTIRSAMQEKWENISKDKACQLQRECCGKGDGCMLA